MAPTRQAVALSVVAVVICGGIGYEFFVAAELRDAIEQHALSRNNPRTDDGRTLRDWLLAEALGDQPRWMAQLIRLRPREQWSGVYTAAGLAGGIVALWLLWGGLSAQRSDMPSIVARVLAAGVAGWIMLLFLQLPAPVMSRFFVIDTVAAVEAGDRFRYFGSLWVLALLAGIFASTFYERIHTAFSKILGGKE